MELSLSDPTIRFWITKKIIQRNNRDKEHWKSWKRERTAGKYGKTKLRQSKSKNSLEFQPLF
jgi:hypothetical protein